MTVAEGEQHASNRPAQTLISTQVQATIRWGLGGPTVTASGLSMIDQAVTGSTPGRGAIESTIGQLSLPSLRGR